MVNKYCSECDKKRNCQALCKKNEEYTNQDYVRRREKLLHDLQLDTQPGKPPQTGGTSEIILQLFFIDRKTTKEVAEIVFVSARYVRKIIAKYKPIIALNIKKSVPFRRICISIKKPRRV